MIQANPSSFSFSQVLGLLGWGAWGLNWGSKNVTWTSEKTTLVSKCIDFPWVTVKREKSMSWKLLRVHTCTLEFSTPREACSTLLRIVNWGSSTRGVLPGHCPGPSPECCSWRKYKRFSGTSDMPTSPSVLLRLRLVPQIHWSLGLSL